MNPEAVREAQRSLQRTYYTNRGKISPISHSTDWDSAITIKQPSILPAPGGNHSMFFCTVLDSKGQPFVINYSEDKDDSEADDSEADDSGK